MGVHPYRNFKKNQICKTEALGPVSNKQAQLEERSSGRLKKLIYARNKQKLSDEKSFDNTSGQNQHLDEPSYTQFYDSNLAEFSKRYTSFDDDSSSNLNTSEIKTNENLNRFVQVVPQVSAYNVFDVPMFGQNSRRSDDVSPEESNEEGRTILTFRKNYLATVESSGANFRGPNFKDSPSTPQKQVTQRSISGSSVDSAISISKSTTSLMKREICNLKNKLSKESNTYRQEVIALEERLRSSDEDNSRMAAEIEAFKLKTSKLNERIEFFQIEQANYLEQAQNMEIELRTLRSKVRIKDEDFEVLEQDIESLIKEGKKSNRKEKNLTKVNQELQKEIDSLKERLYSNEQPTHHYQSLEQLMEKIEFLKDQIEEATEGVYEIIDLLYPHFSPNEIDIVSGVRELRTLIENDSSRIKHLLDTSEVISSGGKQIESFKIPKLTSDSNKSLELFHLAAPTKNVISVIRELSSAEEDQENSYSGKRRPCSSQICNQEKKRLESDYNLLMEESRLVVEELQYQNKMQQDETLRLQIIIQEKDEENGRLLFIKERSLIRLAITCAELERLITFKSKS